MPIGLNDTDIEVDYGGGNVFNVDIPKYFITTTTETSNEEIPVVNKDALTRTQYDTGSDVTSGLVAHYKFDGDYNDSNPSATKYNLSVSGSPELSSSISINGESLYLNAYQEFLSTSVNIPMQFNMAFSFWFKRIDNNDHDILMAIGADFFIMAHTGNLFYISNTYGGSEIYGQPSVTWNTNWNYLVFNINSNGTWQLYFNGAEITFTTSGGTYPLTSSRLPTGKLYIGGKDVGYWDGDHDTEGYIDDFRVYNRVLSTTEITNLYNLGAVNIEEGDISGTNEKYIAYKYIGGNDNGSGQSEYNLHFNNPALCDILVVAGGGAGGGNGQAGGGGAGA